MPPLGRLRLGHRPEHFRLDLIQNGLLGGIKRLREGRNEFGVPLLSKVPYIDRLFRNVGIGRETDSLMMMVTPRMRAPLANACARSEGLTWPSVGRNAAPSTSRFSMMGHRVLASAGDNTCISRPKLCAVVAWRFISVSRSGLQASRNPPLRLQTVA